MQCCSDGADNFRLFRDGDWSADLVYQQVDQKLIVGNTPCKHNFARYAEALQHAALPIGNGKMDCPCDIGGGIPAIAQ